MNDYSKNIFYVPLLHLEVRNWKSKRSQLFDILNNCELNMVGGEEVYTDYHQKHDNVDIVSSIFEEELGIFCNSFNFSEFKILNTWFEVSEQNNFHEPHNHSATGYVAVCYVQYDENQHKPLTLISPFNNFVTGTTLHYIPENIKEGSIIFFPASILHYTRVNNSNYKRIVVSLNLDVRI